MLGYIALAAVAVVVLMWAIGANMSDEKSAAYDKQSNVNDFCDKAMQDAAPGSDKRMTRQLCEDLKAKAKADIKAAK